MPADKSTHCSLGGTVSATHRKNSLAGDKPRMIGDAIRDDFLDGINQFVSQGCMKFSSFRDVWHSRKLSVLHFAIPHRCNDRHYLQQAFGILLNLLMKDEVPPSSATGAAGDPESASGGGGVSGGGATANSSPTRPSRPTLPPHEVGPGSLPFKIGALYALYCLHGTQVLKPPVPIRVSPQATLALMQLRRQLKAAGPLARDALSVLARLVLGSDSIGAADDGGGGGSGSASGGSDSRGGRQSGCHGRIQAAAYVGPGTIRAVDANIPVTKALGTKCEAVLVQEEEETVEKLVAAEARAAAARAGGGAEVESSAAPTSVGPSAATTAATAKWGARMRAQTAIIKVSSRVEELSSTYGEYAEALGRARLTADPTAASCRRKGGPESPDGASGVGEADMDRNPAACRTRRFQRDLADILDRLQKKLPMPETYGLGELERRLPPAAAQQAPAPPLNVKALPELPPKVEAAKVSVKKPVPGTAWGAGLDGVKRAKALRRSGGGRGGGALGVRDHLKLVQRELKAEKSGQGSGKHVGGRGGGGGEWAEDWMGDEDAPRSEMIVGEVDGSDGAAGGGAAVELPGCRSSISSLGRADGGSGGGGGDGRRSKVGGSREVADVAGTRQRKQARQTSRDGSGDGATGLTKSMAKGRKKQPPSSDGRGKRKRPAKRRAPTSSSSSSSSCSWSGEEGDNTEDSEGLEDIEAFVATAASWAGTSRGDLRTRSAAAHPGANGDAAKDGQSGDGSESDIASSPPAPSAKAARGRDPPRKGVRTSPRIGSEASTARSCTTAAVEEEEEEENGSNSGSRLSPPVTAESAVTAPGRGRPRKASSREESKGDYSGGAAAGEPATPEKASEIDASARQKQQQQPGPVAAVRRGPVLSGKQIVAKPAVEVSSRARAPSVAARGRGSSPGKAVAAATGSKTRGRGGKRGRGGRGSVAGLSRGGGRGGGRRASIAATEEAAAARRRDALKAKKGGSARAEEIASEGGEGKEEGGESGSEDDQDPSVASLLRFAAGLKSSRAAAESPRSTTALPRGKRPADGGGGGGSGGRSKRAAPSPLSVAGEGSTAKHRAGAVKSKKKKSNSFWGARDDAAPQPPQRPQPRGAPVRGRPTASTGTVASRGPPILAAVAAADPITVAAASIQGGEMMTARASIAAESDLVVGAGVGDTSSDSDSGEDPGVGVGPGREGSEGRGGAAMIVGPEGAEREAGRTVDASGGGEKEGPREDQREEGEASRRKVDANGDGIVSGEREQSKNGDQGGGKGEGGASAGGAADASAGATGLASSNGVVAPPSATAAAAAAAATASCAGGGDTQAMGETSSDSDEEGDDDDD